MSAQAQLTDRQLLRLEELLAEPALEQAMRLDEAQGYLCAALSGPQPAPEERWLREVLGDTDEAGDAVREAAELLRRFAAQLQLDLASGQPLMLLLYGGNADDESLSDYTPWCEAYLHGVDAAAEDWFEALGADDEQADSDEIAYLDEQISPLLMLSGDAEAAARDAGDDWPSGPELDRQLVECEEKLPQAVTNIYRFWRAQRSIRTVRRDQPKVGRNEPCPCGSGRKFKKCCGAGPG